MYKNLDWSFFHFSHAFDGQIDTRQTVACSTTRSSHGIGIILSLHTLDFQCWSAFSLCFVVCFDAELPVVDCVGFLISIISFHLISDIDWIFGRTIKFIVFVS